MLTVEIMNKGLFTDIGKSLFKVMSQHMEKYVHPDFQPEIKVITGVHRKNLE